MSRRRQVVRAFLSVAGLTAAAGTAHATLLWEGDVSKGLIIFKNLGSEPWGSTENCATGTITPADDAVRGPVWRYHKPSDSPRCENHGIRLDGVPYAMQNNTTY